MFVIEIVNSSKPCWIAEWEGDPLRTIVIENAQTFESNKQANKRIEECKQTRPFSPMVYKVRKASDFINYIRC